MEDLSLLSIEEFWIKYERFKIEDKDEIYSIYVECLHKYKRPFQAYMVLLEDEDKKDIILKDMKKHFKSIYIKGVHTEEELVDYAIRPYRIPKWVFIDYGVTYDDLTNQYYHYDVIECKQSGKLYYFTNENPHIP